MKIITSGSRYLDIDAYAGCVAYAELLQKMHVAARAVSTAPLNQSIPPLVRDWRAPLATEYTYAAGDTYTLVDVSDPDYFEDFVLLDRVDAVIDHHPGFEEYWRQRIGDSAIIEPVGAACTQVFEQWELAGLSAHISETSARLLMCGILDNTLNFGAAITTERDHYAYTELKKYANVPGDWSARYFSACQQLIMDDITQAMADDIKVLQFRTYLHPVAIGQFAVWDADDAVRQASAVCKQQLAAVKSHWFMNVIGISDKRSHFISDIPEVQAWLADVLGVRFEGNTAVANRAWLRKEIMQADIVRASTSD